MDKQQVIRMRDYFINYWKNIGRLTLQQEIYLKRLEIKIYPFTDSGAAGYYSSDDNSISINSAYTNQFILKQTVFHELDHARTSFVKNGKRLTGMWTEQNGTWNKVEKKLNEPTKGEFFGEGITACNGESVYYAYKNQNWYEKPKQQPDMIGGRKQLFPGHTFPSGLWWYKLNGNFISQLAAVMGLTDNEFCALADNGNGREIISKKFNELNNDQKYTFEVIENMLDCVGITAKLALYGVELNKDEMRKYNKYIIDCQDLICAKLMAAYRTGTITESEFIKRFDRFNRYVTTNSRQDVYVNAVYDNLHEHNNNV